MQEKQNKIGIWIDFDKAVVIKASEEMKTIESNIEHFNVHGGSRSKASNGPQDNVSESKLLARNKQQQHDFFIEIIKEVNPKDSVVIFGPAEAKLGLKKAFLDNSSFKHNTIPVETADSMTENQMKDWVRNY